MKNIIVLGLVLTVVSCGFFPHNVDAGVLTYAACQTGCNKVAVACYSAGGFIMGTLTLGLGVPATILSCSAAQGSCMAGCAVLLP